MRVAPQQSIDLIKQFEGRKLNAYQDQGGVWTIGYGHTDPTVCSGMTITPDQADSFLKQDLDKLCNIDYYIRVPLTDNQYGALICLAFNIGAYALRMSALLRCVNANEDPTAEWMKWNHIHGVVNEGLTRRRSVELELWFGRNV